MVGFEHGHSVGVIRAMAGELYHPIQQHNVGEESLDPSERLIYIVTCFFLVVLSGICAGLTLGLLYLDK